MVGFTDYVESTHAHPDLISAKSTSPSEPYSIKPLVTNATLGFEKVIAIGLPERSDRRDTLTLTATINDIDIEWIDAVKGTDVHKKAWPAHWNTGKMNRTIAELGNWRSHINAVRTVMEAKYSSALIIEDDADWDVALKRQLTNFANKTRALSNAGRNESLWTTSDTPTHSPYGDDWDLLWLGNCATPPAPPEIQPFPGEGEQAHYVFPARGGMSCLYGYAITSKSAKTLMGWLLDLDEPTDFAISQYCEHFRCVAVWPQLIGEHKPMGPRRKDSSIKEGDDGSFREKGETSRIVHSAILDMLEKLGHKGRWEG
ncbi:MAG: hypothetical protein Q9224_004862 [Gallowayella concinna]